MIDEEKQFENLVRQIKFDDSPDTKHRDQLEQDLLGTLARQAPRQTKIWRIIMKRPITKLATAAVIILIAVLSITFLERSVTPTWAIEDTAKVLDEFNGIYISGVVRIPIKEFGGKKDVVLKEGQEMSVVAWAQANEQRTKSGNIKMQTGDGAIGAVYDGITYRYDPNANILEIEHGESVNLSPWPSGEFLVKLREFMKDWQILYGKDAATGRDYAFITCSNPFQNQSWWLEIDLETNLPVRAKGWNNVRREGVPSMDLQRIAFFEELPDEVFEFDIPEDAQIIDWREQFRQIFGDPNYGMSAEGLTKDEACKRIIEQYWQAMIDEDWEKARKLRSFPEGRLWEDMKAQYYDNMPAEIIEIQQPYSEDDWVTIAIVIRMSDGTVTSNKLMIKFRQINNIEWCHIVGNYGPRELNAID
ncbi:MAG: hypothetical protein ACYS0I_09365 [Planctomycetota bacterium]|jgi:hypothetical protein